jgi:hypothetical protein
LLDADAEGTDWAEAARTVFHIRAYKIKVVAGSVRQTPSHIWEREETLGNVRKQHDDQTQRALDGEHR